MSEQPLSREAAGLALQMLLLKNGASLNEPKQKPVELKPVKLELVK